MTRTLLFAGVTAAATLVLALGASAEDGATTTAPAPTAPAAEQAPMSIAQIAAQLEARGYTVREIEMERGVYEVEMTDANGMRVEAYLDPVTGEAMPWDFDDDGDRDDDRRDD